MFPFMQLFTANLYLESRIKIKVTLDHIKGKFLLLLLLLLENNIRRGNSTVLGDKYIESSVGTHTSPLQRG